jgi:hypothetical protein
MVLVYGDGAFVSHVVALLVVEQLAYACDANRLRDVITARQTALCCGHAGLLESAEEWVKVRLSRVVSYCMDKPLVEVISLCRQPPAIKRTPSASMPSIDAGACGFSAEGQPTARLQATFMALQRRCFALRIRYRRILSDRSDNS